MILSAVILNTFGLLSAIFNVSESQIVPLTTSWSVAKQFLLRFAMSGYSMENCPLSAPFFGFMGVTSALVFASKF